MTCEELLKALNDYVDGAQLTEICEEFCSISLAATHARSLWITFVRRFRCTEQGNPMRCHLPLKIGYSKP